MEAVLETLKWMLVMMAGVSIAFILAIMWPKNDDDQMSPLRGNVGPLQNGPNSGPHSMRNMSSIQVLHKISGEGDPPGVNAEEKTNCH